MHGSYTLSLDDLLGQTRPAPALASALDAAVAGAAELPDTTVAQRPVFERVSSKAHTHELGYTVVSDRMLTKPLYLRNGDLAFTAFDETIVPMPEGDYAVLSVVGDVVDCNNESVPLDVVYNHHWLLKPIEGPTTHFNSPCPKAQDFAYVFGVGAESRRRADRRQLIPHHETFSTTIQPPHSSTKGWII
jgi:hypothetical protein